VAVHHQNEPLVPILFTKKEVTIRKGKEEKQSVCCSVYNGVHNG
jgi:hypothetical protein